MEALFVVLGSVVPSGFVLFLIASALAVAWWISRD